MATKAFELRKRRVALLEEANAIHVKAESENRAKSGEEREAFEAKVREAGELEGRAAECERIDDLRSTADDRGDRRGDPLPHNDPANTRNGKHAYSLLKAMWGMVQTREGRGEGLNGLELEVHQELEKRFGSKSKCLKVPWDLKADVRAEGLDREQRAGILNTTTGVGSIPTILDTTIIDLLRTRMVVRAAGATVLNDMQGLFAIPRQNAAATGYWVAEGGAPTPSNQTIDQVPFAPKTVGAYTDYTRRFMEQTNQSAEQFVRNDLVAVLARAVDKAALNGQGANNEPLGVAQNPAVPLVALGTNGAAPTWASLVSLETNVAVSNADVGTLSYIMNAKGRSTLKQTLKVTSSTFPIYLWETLPPAPDGMPMGMVNGYVARVTNQLPSTITKGSSGATLSPILFGNWSDLIIAFWSALDLLIDPYTGSNTGAVRVVALQDCDVNIRHPESFSSIVDMITV